MLAPIPVDPQAGNAYWIRKAFSDAEIQAACDSSGPSSSHPLQRFISEAEGHRTATGTMQNTEMALRAIFKNPSLDSWRQSVTKRAASLDDFSDASAAFGEIRAAGYLLLTGIEVCPLTANQSQKTPDFEISIDGIKAYVEVATKLISSNQSKDGSSAYPGGVPTKPGETVGENVGHKISSIKPGAGQAPQGSTCFLWVDLQDDGWWPASVEHCCPVITNKGEFTSGGIWHGIYGTKGLPTYERYDPRMPVPGAIYPQSYDSFFEKGYSWSGLFVSLRSHTLLFENPDPGSVIPRPLIPSLLCLPDANIADWWVRWPFSDPAHLELRICQARKMLHQLK
jgi:hypothetical protein